MHFDQVTSQFVSNNDLNAGGVSSSGRQSLSSNERRLPGAVLLARARLLERLRGVSVSTNRLVLTALYKFALVVQAIFTFFQGLYSY